MQEARAQLALLRFARLIVSQLGSISSLRLIPTIHSFSSLRVQRNAHGALANPDLSQAMAPSKQKRTHAVFRGPSAHRSASTSKPRFVGEYRRVKLSEICSKGKSSLRQKDVFDDGPYAVYGASGIVGTMSVYQNEAPYVAVVKDGAGVGRANACEPMTSVLGTMQALIPNSDVDRDYLLHLVRSLHLGRGFSGSTIPHIYFRDYGKIEVPLPSIDAQKRIVFEFGSVEAQIAQAETQIKQLDSLVKSRFVEMFGDPAAADTKHELLAIGNFADVQTGATPLRRKPQYYGGSIPWVKTGEVACNFANGVEEDITEVAIKETNCKVFPAGTVLVAMYGQGDTRGKAAILPFEAATNQACAAILPSSTHNEVFLNAQLQLLYEDMRAKSLGGNQKNLSLGIIKSMKVILPSMEAQQEFASFASQVDKSRFVRDHEMNFR